VAQRHLRQRGRRRGPDAAARLLPAPDAGPARLPGRGGPRRGPVAGRRPPHGAQPADPRGSGSGPGPPPPHHHGQHRTVRATGSGSAPDRTSSTPLSEGLHRKGSRTSGTRPFIYYCYAYECFKPTSCSRAEPNEQNPVAISWCRHPGNNKRTQRRGLYFIFISCWIEPDWSITATS